jgi:hypothetical protein
MSKPIIRVHDIETDEVIDREMTDAEYASYQESQAANIARQAEAEAKTVARAALLAQLGITEEQAKLLLS